MSRYHAPIKKAEFLALVKQVMGHDDFPHHPAQLKKDLSKVLFDTENWTRFDDAEAYSKYPVGYRHLGDGLHVFFVNAGGDWEFPICFVLYWDGSAIRGYIPNDGNAYHKAAKAAYGSVCDSDHYDPERDGDDPDGDVDSPAVEAMINHTLMFHDIEERIKPRPAP